MEEENKTSQSAVSRRPGIRTMKSDAQEYFKTSKPSLLDLVGKQTEVRPSDFEPKKKLNVFPIVLGALILIGAGTLAYFFLLPARHAEEVKKLVPPTPFFATESSRTITVGVNNREQFLRLMTDSFIESERFGTIKRILIKLQEDSRERFALFSDFKDLYRMAPPPALLSRLDPPFMTFLYSSKEGSRFGLAVRIQDPDRVFFDMLSWESSIVLDMRPLFFGESPEGPLTAFEDRTYRNIDWRYQKLSSTKDLGLGYAIFPAKNLLVIAISKETMETIINRLFDAQ